MTGAISERIQAAEAKIAAMKAKRGAAILDDADFDAAEYVSVEHELEALRDAEAISVRRERAAAGQARADRRGADQARLHDLFQQYLKDWGEADAYARRFAATFAQIEASHAEMVSIAHRLDSQVPSTLSAIDLPNRASNYLTAVLKSIPGHSHRLGRMQLHHSMTKPADDWAETEARMLRETINRLTEK